VWDFKTQKLDRRVRGSTQEGSTAYRTPVFWTNKGNILAIFRLSSDNP
jgi:hypothetical protein